MRAYRVEERRDAADRKARRREERRRHRATTDQFTEAQKAELIRKAKASLLNLRTDGRSPKPPGRPD